VIGERHADQAFHRTFDSDAQLEPVQQH